ncbi:GNAT family acetyltransferase [Ceratobasidium sp. AG-Ba]|nr:GNAT family acetyltransferase [Ceratobasidium sp. AG-Ba]
MSLDAKAANKWSLRPATSADRPALSRICLLTGDAGQSAESEYTIPELLGLVYAEPYAVVDPCFGFVLVDEENDEVIGYVLSTPDTRQFEAAIEKEWYTPLRTNPRYLKSPYPKGATDSDKNMINLIHKPDTAPDEIIQVSKAHIHIDLLPRAQRQGWGTRMIGKAVEHLKGLGNDSLYVGIDPRNSNARAFYLAIGFEFVPTSGGECYRLDFSKWKY